MCLVDLFCGQPSHLHRPLSKSTVSRSPGGFIPRSWRPVELPCPSGDATSHRDLTGWPLLAAMLDTLGPLFTSLADPLPTPGASSSSPRAPESTDLRRCWETLSFGSFGPAFGRTSRGFCVLSSSNLVHPFIEHCCWTCFEVLNQNSLEKSSNCKVDKDTKKGTPWINNKYNSITFPFFKPVNLFWTCPLLSPM